MGAVIAAVHLPDRNGLPKDDAMNTFVFGATGIAPAAIVGNVRPALEAFYNTGNPDRSISIGLAQSLDDGVDKCFVMWYQLAPLGSEIPVTPLGGPIERTDFTLFKVGGGTPAPDLPREAAAVLTIEGAMSGLAEDAPGGVPGPKGDTHPAARHRGRIYLGPLCTFALGAGTNGPGLSAVWRGDVTVAASKMGTAVGLLGTGEHYWAVWSRKDAKLYPVTHGYMDDAFDTQRRRGIGATNRSTFGL